MLGLSEELKKTNKPASETVLYPLSQNLHEWGPQIRIFIDMSNYFYDQLNLETAFLISPVIPPPAHFTFNNISTSYLAQRFQTQCFPDTDDGEGGPG